MQIGCRTLPEPGAGTSTAAGPESAEILLRYVLILVAQPQSQRKLSSAKTASQRPGPQRPQSPPPYVPDAEGATMHSR
jgi:hypothetical protein